jgi:flagellar biosynthesis protein FlhB
MPDDQGGGGEKTEDPTPKKLRDAREQGQVAVSQEVTSTAMLLIGFGALVVVGPWMHREFAAVLRWALTDGLRWEPSVPDTGAVFLLQFYGPGLALFSFAGLLALFAGMAVAAQTGLNFSLKPLEPKPNKLNPIAGLGRLFGLRGMMKFVVNVLKLTLVVSVAWWSLSSIVPEQIRYKPDLDQRYEDMCWMVLLFGIELAAVLLVVALLDYIYQRWQHHRDLMMTKHEVKEEFKQSEGDPLVKGKIRQIQRQMAQQRMMQEVPKADVVITNPTHVAVALQYDRATMVAPVCVAKGYDLIAQRIKQIASEHDIIQVENVALARALAKAVEVGQEIPLDFYQQVAEVLGYVYRLRGKRA